MRKFQTQNHNDCRPTNLLLSCQLWLSDKAKSRLVTKFTRKVWISDILLFKKMSRQCTMPTGMNDDHHAAFIHASNWLTHHWDLVHIVLILKIGYCMSWKSRRRRWLREGEEVGLYYSKASKWIYMPWIAGRNCGIVTHLYHALFQ